MRQMSLLLRGVRLHSEGRTRVVDVRLRGGRVAEEGRDLRPGRRERVLDVRGDLALPGLVNGHDHLGLDLFPRLGSPPYPDFYHWGRDIHHPERSPLREILRVPLEDRLLWGGYRNLISGVTTVMHHDPYHRRLFGGVERLFGGAERVFGGADRLFSLFRAGAPPRFPIRVIGRYGWAHSLGHEPDVAGAFARSRGRPFVIHAMEGVNDASRMELDRLDELGVLASNTVLVHAVALAGELVERVARAGAAVVWCPVSNRFLYGSTLPVEEVKGRVPFCLGTDSTLSGSATLLDEAREAAAVGAVSAEEILELVTTRSAAVFDLRDGRGTLRAGAPADLVLLAKERDAGQRPAAERLLDARPADIRLVLVGGRPRLADPALADALGLGEPNARVEGAPRWIHGSLQELKERIAGAVGDGELLRRNPAWSMLEAGASAAPGTHPRPEEEVAHVP